MKTAYEIWQNLTDEIKQSGLWKSERVITSQQFSQIDTSAKSKIINMCANNYLGLANNKEDIELV